MCMGVPVGPASLNGHANPTRALLSLAFNRSHVLSERLYQTTRRQLQRAAASRSKLLRSFRQLLWHLKAPQSRGIEPSDVGFDVVRNVLQDAIKDSVGIREGISRMRKI